MKIHGGPYKLDTRATRAQARAQARAQSQDMENDYMISNMHTSGYLDGKNKVNNRPVTANSFKEYIS